VPLEILGVPLEILRVPSATHVPCIHRSQNTFLGTRVFVTLFFETRFFLT
jgi:hypothetical protein